MAPLKRREFGQLAAASLTSTILADLSSKAIAQNSGRSQEVLYGVNLLQASVAQNREDQTPPVELNVAELATGTVLSKTNLPAQSVDNRSPVQKKSRAFFVSESDRITKAIVQGDGTFAISTVSSTRNGYFNHLLVSVGRANNSQFRAKKVRGFEKSDRTIESVLSLANDRLLCLVGTEGTPPFSFAILDARTGQILSGDALALPTLPLNHRFANLCQDAKGNIFATETGPEGIPILISMNLQERAIVTGQVKINRLNPLNFEGRALVNDVKDLAFSSSGQLYALATDNSGRNNALFAVDANTGRMGLLRNFAAEKFAFSLQ